MNVKISFPEQGVTAEVSRGSNLLDVIRASALPIEAPCGGRGTCGKCKVRVNGRELQACKTTAEEDAEVFILAPGEGQDILTESAAPKDDAHLSPDSGLAAFAIDIGTTTVVVRALDTGSGRQLGVRAFTNPQRPYGADVLSRINISMDDASLLSGIITEALDRAITGIIGEAGPGKLNVVKIVIAGNTTMSYLLLNLRCRSLGLAPFEAEYEIEPAYTYARVLGTDTLDCPVLIYPYISSFVGGDIVSGLVHIQKHWETAEDASFMLVDMGTNGEIAFRCRGRMITTSTAAGPALEGGNITCGMSGTEGAIYAVGIPACAGMTGDGAGMTGGFSVRTIGDAPAQGICGSGVIDLVAKLLDAGLVETTGAFSSKGLEQAIDLKFDASNDRTMKALVIEEETPDNPQIVFTQKDVREFQLAKGAIRAGIDILIAEMGELPGTFYLAGGFGQNIDLESAFATGLIPDTMRGRIRFAGNTSLGGCVDACLLHTTGQTDNLPALCAGDGAVEINLGAHKDFNNLFMETMMF
ncbi:MAG: ASKHA domain-containing protein [Clostridiales Family XIII bacterium]|jgi:uncharacterized 2Fe-2S/4Fe-4S cluster protein (DUF4445 family)|nr:ASKHA domain-containing protein [Clostridiales Family XIII bacterium]